MDELLPEEEKLSEFLDVFVDYFSALNRDRNPNVTLPSTVDYDNIKTYIIEDLPTQLQDRAVAELSASDEGKSESLAPLRRLTKINKCLRAQNSIFFEAGGRDAYLHLIDDDNPSNIPRYGVEEIKVDAWWNESNA